MVCLGGYGTHWVPSLHLDELCIMLWDMARFHNYDIRSPYNREAALWVANQIDVPLPDRHAPAPRPPRRARAGSSRWPRPVAESASDGSSCADVQDGVRLQTAAADSRPSDRSARMSVSWIDRDRSAKLDPARPRSWTFRERARRCSSSDFRAPHVQDRP